MWLNGLNGFFGLKIQFEIVLFLAVNGLLSFKQWFKPRVWVIFIIIINIKTLTSFELMRFNFKLVRFEGLFNGSVNWFHRHS